MGVDASTSPSDSVERLRRWERAGGTWRVVGRSVGGDITVALDTCHGEEMERLTSGETELAVFIGSREASAD